MEAVGDLPGKNDSKVFGVVYEVLLLRSKEVPFLFTKGELNRCPSSSIVWFFAESRGRFTEFWEGLGGAAQLGNHLEYSIMHLKRKKKYLIRATTAIVEVVDITLGIECQDSKQAAFRARSMHMHH